VTRSGEFGEYWANFCDSLRRIWRVLSKFLWLASANLASIERIGRVWRIWRIWRIWRG
jgi:hypothetical protein